MGRHAPRLAVLTVLAASCVISPVSAGAVASYLVVSGASLTYNGQTVTLRGENFNNEPGLACCGGPDINKINARPADYSQVSSVLNENSIRFGLDYQWYASNRINFFSVLDQHVASAKSNQLWMIPVMLMPPGGSNGGYGGQDGFWNSPTNQLLLTNFWTDLAAHYATEPTMAGYDLFNEPAPPNASAYASWAQTTYNAITAADPNHFVVLEESSASWDVPAVTGNRILWSSHCYATVATSGCNFPGPNPASPSKRPFWIGEVGATLAAGTAYVPGDLSNFNQQGVSWAHFVMHEVGYGLYQNWNAGNFSQPWSSMIRVLQSAARGAIKPTL